MCGKPEGLCVQSGGKHPILLAEANKILLLLAVSHHHRSCQLSPMSTQSFLLHVVSEPMPSTNATMHGCCYMHGFRYALWLLIYDGLAQDCGEDSLSIRVCCPRPIVKHVGYPCLLYVTLSTDGAGRQSLLLHAPSLMLESGVSINVTCAFVITILTSLLSLLQYFYSY